VGILRRRKTTRPPSVRWNIYVPFDIAAIIDNEFWSNAYGKPMYGKRQELIIELLRNYIATHKLAEKPLRLGEQNPGSSTPTPDSTNPEQ
jgi:hypothetical protein